MERKEDISSHVASKQNVSKVGQDLSVARSLMHTHQTVQENQDVDIDVFNIIEPTRIQYCLTIYSVRNPFLSYPEIIP